MKKAKIIVHCLVANEERFIWYALNSVLKFVDKIMVWDTGSSDNTVKLVKKINSNKIEIKELDTVNAEEHTKVRDQMLKSTDVSKFDWLLILDGDEIWTPDMFQKMILDADTNKSDAVVVKTINFVGDIYHKEPDSAGHYRFGDRVGHYNLRLINLKLPNLHVSGIHGQQGYYSGDLLLQNLPPTKISILDDVYYFHATHLNRSPYDKRTTKRSFKKKFEIGEPVSKKDLPRIFFEHPSHIPVVTKKFGFSYWLRALLETLPRRLKRIILPPKEGY